MKNDIPFKTELCELFYKYRADKCPQVLHSYSPEYYRLLNPLRNKVKKVLEIGIGSREMMEPLAGEDYVIGASLHAWADFFPNATVFGLDIDPELIFQDERIQCFISDQSDPAILIGALNQINVAGNRDPFDLIVDDGSHNPDHMISSFMALWPYISEGGFYIIEDIQLKDSNLFLNIPASDCEKHVHLGNYYWDCFIAFRKVSGTPVITIFETRDEMLSLLSSGSTIAELGVFNGNFSEKILDINQPRELVLIDHWGNWDIVSGNADGDDIRSLYGVQLYNDVNRKFSSRPEVKIIRDWTSHILSFPDNYFDMVYIDADHEYPAVLKDLEACFSKVKHGGWLMGHDYEMNHEKTQTGYSFGVKRSVEEFCFKRNQRLSVKGMDGCVSFGIKVDRNASPFKMADIVGRVQPYTMVGAERLVENVRAVQHVVKLGVPGDVVEVGVWKGGSMMAMIFMLKELNELRRVHLYDTFEGLTEGSVTGADVDLYGALASDQIESIHAMICVGLEEVTQNICRTGYPESHVLYHQGDILKTSYFPEQISILRLDTDWYELTKFELEKFYDRVSPGGIVIIDDYGHWQGCRKAVDDFIAGKNIQLAASDYTGVYWMKE